MVENSPQTHHASAAVVDRPRAADFTYSKEKGPFSCFLLFLSFISLATVVTETLWSRTIPFKVLHKTSPALLKTRPGACLRSMPSLIRSWTHIVRSFVSLTMQAAPTNNRG